ncbi:hypothetical protein BFJ68_g6670 [Fusarium oxysporum]|uniref:DUF676 domain-containing protein n=1 Tax=Fusarium oxysporum TaxID=5507 RepID=A0A420RB76_FUSOX|nr:hypothetical protein BFJ68_g6670 [Fusarium oxysporum]
MDTEPDAAAGTSKRRNSTHQEITEGPIDIDDRCSTGTATFQNVPKQLQNGRPWKILLPKLSETQSTCDRYLVIDDEFLGITPLYSPHPEYHKIDIIAISGLGGHAFGSFKERDGNHMWLRDSLPSDLTHEDTTEPTARVMIYGYESSVANSNNFQNLEDLSTSFHNSLLALARAPTTRPIIFVAHSLGGLIVKQSKNEDDLKLVKATYGIVFFGVPHDGMAISSLIPMVMDGPNRFLIESIGHVNPQILSIQQREFHAALGEEGDSEIVCFYETEKSPTGRKSVRLVTASYTSFKALNAQAEAPTKTKTAIVAATFPDTQRTGVAPSGFLIKRSRDSIIRSRVIRNTTANHFSMLHQELKDPRVATAPRPPYQTPADAALPLDGRDCSDEKLHHI